MSQDYYKILGVSKSASQDEIKTAYRKLAKEFHPDLNKDNPSAAAKFKEINQAYEVLSDTEKKANYDRFGSETGPDPSQFYNGGGNGGGFKFGMDDIFNIFNSFAGGGAQNFTSRGRDINVEISLSFEEACLGIKRNINIMRTDKCNDCRGTGARDGTQLIPCDECDGTGYVRYSDDTIFGKIVNTGICRKCNGTGKLIHEKCPTCGGKGVKRSQSSVSVTIPGGVEDGQTVTVRGYGDADPRGRESGDLQILVNVAKHPVLKREGYNVVMELPVPFTIALFGGKIVIPSVQGKLELNIPEGTQTGTILKLSNKGAKMLNRNASGDMLITVKVDLPKITTKGKKELQELLESKFGPDKFEKYNNYLKAVKNL